jgi:hypothetical protein
MANMMAELTALWQLRHNSENSLLFSLLATLANKRTARRFLAAPSGTPFATVVGLWRRSNACMIWTTAKKKRMVGLLSGGRD